MVTTSTARSATVVTTGHLDARYRKGVFFPAETNVLIGVEAAMRHLMRSVCLRWAANTFAWGLNDRWVVLLCGVWGTTTPQQ